MRRLFSKGASDNNLNASEQVSVPDAVTSPPSAPRRGFLLDLFNRIPRWLQTTLYIGFACVLSCISMGSFLLGLNAVTEGAYGVRYGAGQPLVAIMSVQVGQFEPTPDGGCKGFECDLLTDMAKSLNMTLKPVEAQTFSRTRYLFLTKKVHLAALRLPETIILEGAQSSISYITTSFNVIRPTGIKIDFNDKGETIPVPANEFKGPRKFKDIHPEKAYERLTREVNAERKEQHLPPIKSKHITSEKVSGIPETLLAEEAIELAEVPLRFMPHTLGDWMYMKHHSDASNVDWQVHRGSPMTFFERVDAENAAALMDRQTFLLSRHYFPQQESLHRVARDVDIVFHLPNNASESFATAVNAFLEKSESNGRTAILYERYYGFVHRLHPMDLAKFYRKIRDELPKYRPIFEKAAKKTGLDWRLIAALAYQESHWDMSASSKTGVKGFMMLTNETMRELGVRNPNSVYENVLAGAKYLSNLRDGLPKTIKEPDRTWMALAAYNIGLRAMKVGLAYTQQKEGDYRYWRDVKRIMPRLSRSNFAKNYNLSARGGEAVIMVDNIRAFYTVLDRYYDKS